MDFETGTRFPGLVLASLILGATLLTPSLAAADPVAAQAAFEVAVGQYPDQGTQFEWELSRWLGQVGDGPAKAAGIALGRASASAILDARRDDGWNSEAEYQWHPMGPGVYAEFQEHSGTPTGFVFGAGWPPFVAFMLATSPGGETR